MKYFKKPFDLLLLASVLFIIVSLFYLDVKLDVNFHDSYFVFPSSYIIWSWVVMLLLYWGIYKIFRKSLWSNKLTWFHVLATIFVFTFHYFTTFQSFLKANDGFWWGEADQNQQLKGFTQAGVMIVFLISQLCFVVNIVAGLIKKIKTGK